MSWAPHCCPGPHLLITICHLSCTRHTPSLLLPSFFPISPPTLFQTILSFFYRSYSSHPHFFSFIASWILGKMFTCPVYFILKISDCLLFLFVFWGGSFFFLYNFACLPFPAVSTCTPIFLLFPSCTCVLPQYGQAYRTHFPPEIHILTLTTLQGYIHKY